MLFNISLAWKWAINFLDLSKFYFRQAVKAGICDLKNYLWVLNIRAAEKIT
jgi:hypothetical protein